MRSRLSRLRPRGQPYCCGPAPDVGKAAATHRCHSPPAQCDVRRAPRLAPRRRRPSHRFRFASDCHPSRAGHHDHRGAIHPPMSRDDAASGQVHHPTRRVCRGSRGRCHRDHHGDCGSRRDPGGRLPGATADHSSRHPTHRASGPNACGWASARARHRSAPHRGQRRGCVCANCHLCRSACRHRGYCHGWGGGSVGCQAVEYSRHSSETMTWTHAARHAGHPRASVVSRMAIASGDSDHS